MVAPFAPARSASLRLSNRFWLVVVLLFLSAVALLPYIPPIHTIPETDSAIFEYIGRKILQGRLPFRDVYDHKPPLIFYLNALGLYLGMGTQWGIWLLEYLSLSAASLLGYRFLRAYFGRVAALLAVIAMQFNLVFVLDFGNLTEEYALPFLFAALFLLSRGKSSARTRWNTLGVGLMLGMASTLKQPMAGIALSIAVYLLVRHLLSRDYAGLVFSYIWIGLGVCAVWLAWTVYFLLAGAFNEFWEAAFLYNVALSNIPLAARIESLLIGLERINETSRFFLLGMLFWLSLIPYLLVKLVRSRSGIFSSPPFGMNWLLPATVAMVDFPVALALASLSGNNFRHYYIALLPSVTILTALGYRLLAAALARTCRRPVAFLWALLLFVPVLAPGLAQTFSFLKPRSDAQTSAVVSYILEHTRPGEPVYIWGFHSAPYLLTHRDASSRFFFTDPLFVSGYSGREKAEQFLKDLQANPPVLLIDQAIPRLPLVTADPGACEQVKDPDYYRSFNQRRFGDQFPIPDLPDGMGEVYYWICEHYDPVGTVGKRAWNVYRLKGK